MVLSCKCVFNVALIQTKKKKKHMQPNLTLKFKHSSYDNGFPVIMKNHFNLLLWHKLFWIFKPIHTLKISFKVLFFFFKKDVPSKNTKMMNRAIIFENQYMHIDNFRYIHTYIYIHVGMKNSGNICICVLKCRYCWSASWSSSCKTLQRSSGVMMMCI